MTRRVGVARGCLAFLLCYSVSLATSKCCEKKVVPGISSKAGTYNLVSTSEKLPDFCLGGCVYTKEGDPAQPVTNYCFQEGAGEATCSGAGCGGGGGREVEGWIEKYFERECSMQINSVLEVSVRKQYSYGQQSCGSNNYGLTNVSVEVYDNPACEGNPVQIGMAEGEYGYARAVFLIKVKDTKPWSLFLSKEGFKNTCEDIGLLVPFSQNRQYLYMTEEKTESTIIPTVSLNFTFTINTELLSDVFVQGNPASCVNYTSNYPFKISKKRRNTKNGKSRQKHRNKKEKKKPKQNSDYEFFMRNPAKSLPRSYGSGSGSGSGGGGGSNYKCNPTCKYTSWNTDPLLTPCNCKGVIGGGLNFSDLTLPDQQDPAGKAMMTGSLYWYNDTSISPYWYQGKLYTTFAEFTRRNTTSVKVCDSKLTVSIESKPLKTVPCFDPQIPPTAPLPTFPAFPGQSGITPPGFIPGMLTTDSPLGSGSGSGSSLPWPTSYPQWLTTADQEDMFSEVDGVLVFGKSDRFWIFGCMPEDSVDQFLTFAVDFFTYKDPRETPEFCGCLLSTVVGGGNAEVSKEQVKECYVKAVTGGPSQRTAQTWNRSKMTKKKQKQLQKKYERRLENKDKRVLKRMNKIANRGKTGFKGNAKENLKKFVKKMKQKQNPLSPGRSIRDTSDQDMIDDDEEQNDPQDVDFVDFDNQEYEDYSDEYEDYLDEYEEDYEELEDDLLTDYETSSGWNFL